MQFLDNEINQIRMELSGLQKRLVDKLKMFSTYLCSFQNIEQTDFAITNNSIKFKGTSTIK